MRVAWREGARVEVIEADPAARSMLFEAPPEVLLQAAGVAPAVAHRAVTARLRMEAGESEAPHRGAGCRTCRLPSDGPHGYCSLCVQAERYARQAEPAPALPVVAALELALDVEPETLPPAPAPLPEPLAKVLRRMMARSLPSAEDAPATEITPTQPVAPAPERRRRRAPRAREVATQAPRSRSFFDRLARMAPRRRVDDVDDD